MSTATQCSGATRVEAFRVQAPPPYPPTQDTQPVSDDELREYLGEGIEPLDLNRSRAEIKPTTWHNGSVR